MIIKNITGILLLSIFSFILTGMTRVYKERNGQEVTTHRFVIEPKDNGYSIDLESITGERIVKQKMELDRKLAALSWTFADPAEDIDVSAFRKGNKIYLKGRGRGKTIDKTFNINELPWNQSFNIGLEKFVLGQDKSMKFWAIGTKNPGYMKITKFKVKRKEKESITVNSQKVEAVHVTISLTGLLSMFWTGHYWYRVPDGRFLCYRGKSGSGKPKSVMELISESN